MKKHVCKFWLLSFCLCYSLTPSISQAQVTADETLSTEVISSDSSNFIVTGGNQVGSNLFHSFNEFSIPNQGSVTFNNPSNVNNIISRVTGGSISRIDGLIQAKGNTNLLLINPKGIIFSSDAKLNIEGSFLATTADRIKFLDGSFFSASETSSQPLLTVGVPIGLQFGETPGVILNQSVKTAIVPDGPPFPVAIDGLRVKPSKTLALVGSRVIVEGGALFAPSGRVELGSVAKGSLVSLTPTPVGWFVGYDTVREFQDIQLSQATIATNNDPSGEINLYGRQVSVNNNSVVTAVNLGVNRGGNIVIRASESVEVSDSSLDNGSGKLSTGAAGNLTIEAKRLIVHDGFINTATEGKGQAGDLIIKASELVEVRGIRAESQLTSQTFAEGNAGDIKINTEQLVLQDGGEILSASLESGEAGNLQIQARNISLDNEGKLRATSELGTGGGNIFLQGVNSLTLRRNSEISTDAKGDGNGGNITIATDLLTALENSNITANAEGAGRGGNIRIKTQGLFLSPDSQIIATSQRGVDGVVEIDRLENDPENALLTLPAEPVNISGLIAQGCSSGTSSIARKGSEFVITGRGGLPPTPTEAFRGDVALVDLGKPIEAEATQAKVVAPTNNNQNHPESTELVEAQGWVIGSDGEVTLTASAPNVTPSIPWMKSNSCHG